jgi:RNA polymerase sigma-70 factor (ECF subfamily)
MTTWSNALKDRGQTSRSQVAGGSRESRIRHIYEANYALVHRIALRYGAGNAAWAEDVVQDVFMTLVDRLDTLHADTDPGPWLSRVTTNRCLNVLRRERRWRLVSQLIPGRRAAMSAPDPELLSGMRESVRRAYVLIQELPPKQRVAFFMHRVEGCTQEEVAAQIGHSRGYVNKLIKRAEAHLRDSGWIDDQEVPGA